MNEADLYALMTSAVGVILLLGWLYITIDNPRSTTMLVKSVFMFVLPGVVITATPPSLFQFPLALWLVILFEEVLKSIAARSEVDRMNRFFIVTLFGIWELIWVKPFWGLHHGSVLQGSTSVQLIGFTAAGTVAVLMHSVTAEIYAFRFNHRVAMAMGVSWLLHTAFDESVGLLGISVTASLLQLLPLVILFVALWPRNSRTSAAR